MQQASRISFALRAAAAIGLMVGFYALALGIVAACLGVLLLNLRVHSVVLVKLSLVAAAAAYGVLRGVFFVTDRFKAPGPELTRAQEPKLFDLIDEVATKMGARLPKHVYLMPDVNAFVAEVGGWLGPFGTHRVLAIGAGLLNTDSVGQLRATIAHEFGHFQGGDTQLGAFLYRTRASMGRVLDALGDSWLSIPFSLYGRLFIRLTQAISRRQELAADAFSVQIAGKEQHIEGLRREAVGGALFNDFLADEVTPLLQESCRPTNLFEGFRLYLDNLGADGVLARVEAILDERPTDPHDSHPALRERIAYAESLSDVKARPEHRLSRELLSTPDATETMMSRFMLSNVSMKQGEKARELGWGEVAGTVYAARIGRASKTLDQLVGADDGLEAMLAHLANATRPDLALKIVKEFGEEGVGRSHEILIHTMGARVATALSALPGAAWEAAPGRSVGIRLQDGQFVNPFALVTPAVEDPAKVPALRAELARFGLTTLTEAAAG